MAKISGVYKITNKVTNNFYIGSSKNIEHRWANHKSYSTWKDCPNNPLYIDFQKYGLDNFIFEIIEETAILKEREQYYIDFLKPSYNDRRVKNLDIERNKKTHKKACKKYNHTEKCKEVKRKSNKKYYNKFCLYNGETLTLGSLSNIFCKQGIPHPTQEAKKYLISN